MNYPTKNTKKEKGKQGTIVQKISTATLTTAKKRLFYLIAHCNKDKRKTPHTTFSLALSNVHLCVVIV